MARGESGGSDRELDRPRYPAWRSSGGRPANLGRGSALRPFDLVVLAGLAVAVVGFVGPMLAPDSLYRDDAWQALATRVPLGQLPRVGVTAPGYAFVLRVWSSIAGRGNLALQMPGLVAAIAAPVALYFLAKRLGHSRAAAVTSAVLLLTAFKQVEFAARVKPYVPDVLVAIVLLWLSLRVLDSSERLSRWVVLTGTATVALVFSASTAPVAVASLGVPALATMARAGQRRIAMVPVVCCAAYGAFLGVWYFVVLKAVRTGQLGEAWLEHRSKASGGRVPVTMRAIDRFFTFQSPHPARILGAALACAVVVGAVWLLRRRGAAVVGLILAPIPIAAALQLAGKVPLGTGRTDLYLYPSSLLLGSAAIDAIARWRPVMSRWRSAGPVLAGGMVVALLAASVASSSDRAYPDTGAKAAAAFVRAEAGPDDSIITAPELGYVYALYAPEAVSARADAASLTSFTPVIGDQRVVVLPHFSAGSPAVPDRVASTVRSIARDLVPPARLWLLEFASVNKFNPVMRGALDSSGCDVLSTRSWTGVTATEWTCG